MEEEWRPIHESYNAEGYFVSNKGRIKNDKDYYFKLTKDLKGYPTACVRTKEGKNKQFQVHRAVALTWIPPVEGKTKVNHIDGVRHNNCVSNLEFCTSSENNYKKTKHTQKSSRKIAQYDKKDNHIRDWSGIREITETLEVSPSSIHSVCHGRRKQAHGYAWKYIPDEYIEGEEWKNYDNKISVSSHGRVKSNGIMLFQSKDDGYCHVSTHRKRHQVHRLVCHVFHGPPPDDKRITVHHIDFNPLNNHKDNLMWANHKEQRAYQRPRKPGNHSRRPVIQYNNGIMIKRYDFMIQAYKELGISTGDISRCCRGIQENAGGFQWKYEQDVIGRINI